MHFGTVRSQHPVKSIILLTGGLKHEDVETIDLFCGQHGNCTRDSRVTRLNGRRSTILYPSSLSPFLPARQSPFGLFFPSKNLVASESSPVEHFPFDRCVDTSTDFTLDIHRIQQMAIRPANFLSSFGKSLCSYQLKYCISHSIPLLKR